MEYTTNQIIGTVILSFIILIITFVLIGAFIEKRKAHRERLEREATLEKKLQDIQEDIENSFI